jgi:hypothetical protein
MPTPGLVETTPSLRNRARALVAVAIATPHSFVISRVDGTRSPGRSAPVVMRLRMTAAMRTDGVTAVVTQQP